jgi:segregation and condensation protein B
MARRAKPLLDLDAELDDLPPELRWRAWMGRVEAVIFASKHPVPREVLAGLIGRGCNLEFLIDDIRAELRGRPYDLVLVAGGWQHRTRKTFADAIRAVDGGAPKTSDLTKAEALVLMLIAYFQPLTRAELGTFLGKEISRDLIARLRSENLIAPGPRSPRPGAPYAYVTTRDFLSHFGFESLRDLPDMEMLEDAGLLNKSGLLNGVPGNHNESAEDVSPVEMADEAKEARFED